MNLDELKTVWKEYDSRLSATEEINRKVITSMIRERSVSRIARIRRSYTGMICLFLFYVACLTCCFFGNPFDYSFPAQYLPLVALTLSCIVMAVFLVRARIALKEISLDRQNLLEALLQVITVYVKYRKSFKYTIIMTFCSSVMLSLSRIIVRIPESGISAAIFSMLSFCGILVFSYYYARKKPEWPNLGAEEKGLRADIEELKDFGLK
jgi:FtsH-binding integral membrane protein